MGIDFMDPFPERKVGKKRFVLVVVDKLTEASVAWAFRGAGRLEIITGLERWVRVRGVPRSLRVDVAQTTRSRKLRHWCEQEGN